MCQNPEKKIKKRVLRAHLQAKHALFAVIFGQMVHTRGVMRYSARLRGLIMPEWNGGSGWWTNSFVVRSPS